jgi:hypothetical protein
MVMRRVILLSVLFLFLPVLVFAENGSLKKEGERTADGKNLSERMAKLLQPAPEKGAVDSAHKEPPSAWKKFLKSLTLERVKDENPGEEIVQGNRYAIRLNNQKEVLKVNGQSPLSFNTQIGVITRGINQERIQGLLNRDTVPITWLEDQRSLLQEEILTFSLKIKF